MSVIECVARPSGRFIAAVAACGGLLAAACGDDGSGGPEGAEATGAGTSTTTTEEQQREPDGDLLAVEERIEVVGVDYAFEGLPTSVPAGSTFSFVNHGEEAHEMLAYLLDDEEARTADEIAALDSAELLALFSYPPEFVFLAGPGEEGVAAPDLGDGTVTEPGRYIVTCAFDVGTYELPDEFPSLEDPHFRHGMYGEFIVD